MDSFLKSLGFPSPVIHQPVKHFDFSRAQRRILVIGPMGSGKTEYAARIWRDSLILQKKQDVSDQTVTNGVDRRKVFVVRTRLDEARFSDNPKNVLSYRGGYQDCGTYIASIENSLQLEKLLETHSDCGTWILDEASFYDERIAYVIADASMKRGLIFVYPMLALNFRREIFNETAKLLLETSTDAFLLTAYCEHQSCMEDSFYTYRYYLIGTKECPALYFDPLIIIGGDKVKQNSLEPNYATRCLNHHYLPGKEYTFFTLRYLASEFNERRQGKLVKELKALQESPRTSELGHSLQKLYGAENKENEMYWNSLLVPQLAEKALLYLFQEENLMSEESFLFFVDELSLDRAYLKNRLSFNKKLGEKLDSK